MDGSINKKHIKVLLSKSDQDAHEVAIRYIARTLRDAGIEVIFTRYEQIEDVQETALEEDVSIVGISFYGSGLMYETEKLLRLMRENDMSDIKVMLGGTITPKEKAKLLDMGVHKIFPSGCGTAQDIVDYVQATVWNN